MTISCNIKYKWIFCGKYMRLFSNWKTGLWQFLSENNGKYEFSYLFAHASIDNKTKIIMYILASAVGLMSCVLLINIHGPAFSWAYLCSSTRLGRKDCNCYFIMEKYVWHQCICKTEFCFWKVLTKWSTIAMNLNRIMQTNKQSN